MNNIKEIIEVIRNKKNILILPHILPDGDTIGSSIALNLVLKSMGKCSCILLDEIVPYNLRFLPCGDICTSLADNFIPDLVISVDCSDVDRLGKRKEFFDQASCSLNIDHHITNVGFAKYNFIDAKAAATGELIYKIAMELDIPITTQMATCLYAALSTDTGSFRYDNTSPQTHRIVAKLMESNIDLNKITTEIYQNKPVKKIKLLTEALNTLQFYWDGRLAILYTTLDMLKKYDVQPEDTDGLIEFARDINGVEVGVFLKQMKEHEIKVGFRAKYDADVSEIAKKFGGGGHKKASGCTIYDTLENAKDQIINTIEKCL
ncbi:bifunctional oligoribonuclease/PAP phosphatase NrnA [Clostridiaceae bacterium 35-E11]